MKKFLCLLVLAPALMAQKTCADDSQCLAAIVDDVAGSQIALNKSNSPIGSETGTATLLAEAFLATTTQVVPEVQLKLDAVIPFGAALDSTVTVEIMSESLVFNGPGTLLLPPLQTLFLPGVLLPSAASVLRYSARIPSTMIFVSPAPMEKTVRRSTVDRR